MKTATAKKTTDQLRSELNRKLDGRSNCIFINETGEQLNISNWVENSTKRYLITFCKQGEIATHNAITTISAKKVLDIINSGRFFLYIN